MKKLILFLFLAPLLALAQEKKPPFWNEVQAFKKQDSIQQPAKGQVLLIGSSSFTLWKDVKQAFPGYPILNRAFGGSSLPNLIYYFSDIVTPYSPKQIVIYCGENDFAGDTSLTVDAVVSRFKELFGMIRAAYNHVPVAYVSMKPSPSRAHLMPKYEAANKAIRNYLEGFKYTSFIDVYPAMLKDGKPMPDIFLGDNLHMNAKGYAIWQRIIEPYLLK